jgi:hypothetical protein
MRTGVVVFQYLQNRSDIAMLPHRSFLTATAAAVLVAGFGPPSAPGSSTTSPTPGTGSIVTMEAARTSPCKQFRQTANGGWIMIGSVQMNGTTLENVVFNKGTAEAAVLSQRCLP